MPKRRHFDYCRSQTQNSQIKIISKKELAAMLGVSCSTIYRMVRSGFLPEPLRSPQGYIQGWLARIIEEWQVKIQKS